MPIQIQVLKSRIPNPPCGVYEKMLETFKRSGWFLDDIRKVPMGTVVPWFFLHLLANKGSTEGQTLRSLVLGTPWSYEPWYNFSHSKLPQHFVVVTESWRTSLILHTVSFLCRLCPCGHLPAEVSSSLPQSTVDIYCTRSTSIVALT